MKQIDVQIMGQSYVLGCPEDGEEKLRAAVVRVHDTMSRIRDAGKVRARERIAVLAALNLTFEAEEQRRSAQETLSTASAPEAAATGLENVAYDDPRWGSLLRRLDEALGEDGRLL